MGYSLRAALEALVPPVDTRDPAGRLSGRLVAGIVDLIIAALLAFSVIVIASPARVPAPYHWTLPAGFALMYVLRRLARTGRVRLAAIILSAGGWLAIAQDIQMHGPNTIAIGGFILIVLIGGLTLGPVAALALAGATVALLAAVLRGSGTDRSFAVPSDQMRLVHYTIQLGLVSLLVAWWALHTRRLLRQLHASEARHALLLEESPDAIVNIDRSGIVRFCNAAFETMIGSPRTDIVGRELLLLPAVAREVNQVRLRVASVLAGEGGKTADVEIVHRDGHIVKAEVKTFPLREDGQIVGVISILRDLTERTRAEVERASLQSQLVSAQRMEAVGRFAGGIAHDFNNILTIVLASAGVLARSKPQDQRAVSDIEDAAMRGATLTRQLLTFSRRQPSEARATDVSQGVEALRPMLERMLGEDVTLRLELSASPLHVLLDPGQLDQVLMNLAVNARDAMPGGGTITVRTELVDGGGSGAAVGIVVRDTGSGMNAATRARAFEPFFTTKGEGGTGLGLSVVHGIVDQAGGTVRCDSEPGRGTTFRISLPAVAPPEIAPGVGRADSGPRGPRRVVLVDDDSLVRETVARALRQCGVTVEVMSTPADVDAVEARLLEADALISDIVMPGMTGPDLVDALRRRGSRTPVIFVSGHAGHALVERARRDTRAVLIPKPFTAADVLARLDELGT